MEQYISNLFSFYLIYNLISLSYLIKSHDSAALQYCAAAYISHPNSWLVHAFHTYIIDPQSASHMTHVFLLVYKL